jgi:anti-anti-sigma factor
MNVTINEEGAKALVKLEGRLDTTNADQFMKDITPLMTGSHQEIDVDCTDMEYTSSQGLRMFLMLQKNVSARGAKLVLRNMKPHVKEVFDITGFSHIINIL